MNFNEELERKTGEVERILAAYLPKSEGFQSKVLEAMVYAVSAGGKRLRPLLMAESAALFVEAEEVWRTDGTVVLGPATVEALPVFMAAIEFIHTYSLIHDDLPALDNDDYRRGRKTTHVVYGEDIAVIAGDGLLNYAYETVLRAFGKAVTVEDYRRTECAMNFLGRKAGIYGMVGGQCADLLAEKPETEVTGEMLLYIHKNKTAALIQASMAIGAILAGADEKAVVQIERCAENIGVAFQIQDDILDVTSTLEELGKPVGSDERNQKTTYVSMYGMEAAKTQVEKLTQEAAACMESLPVKNEFLNDLLMYLVRRRS